VTRPKTNLRLRNHIFIPLVILSNTFGNCLLAIGMQHMPDFLGTSLLPYVLGLISSPWILSGTALLALWMVAQLSMFTWADLSYVLPVTASGYIVTAILGKWILGEQVSNIRWAGTLLITFGSMLVSRTPVSTKPRFRGRDR
jgi:drug/metabolite transporter (DMT)-like permease